MASREPVPDRRDPAGQVFGYASIVLGVSAVLLYPLILGFAGLVLGIVSERRGSPVGKAGIFTSFAGMFAGALLGRLLA